MSITLRLREQFIDVLNGYQPSAETVQLLADMPLVILQGVSGAGRNAIINKLVATGRYHFIVSDTTRPPKVRDGQLEQDGVAYNFRSEEEVLEDLRRGRFLEAELIHNQQVSGNNVAELVKAQQSGKILINEVELGGTDAIAAVKPDTLFVFVVPPSYDEWMRRLQAREVMSGKELSNRMTTAARNLQVVLAGDRFSFVVNDKLNDTAQSIDNLVNNGKLTTDQAAARQTAEHILQAIHKHYPQLA